MSWEPTRPHGICGHVYEMIEYAIVLADHMCVGLLFGDTISNKQQLLDIIENKYNLPDETKYDIVNNAIFTDNPKYVIGSNMLLVDGGLRRFQEHGVKLIFKNIICFKCSYMDTIYDRGYKNVTLLQDNRVYNDITPEDCDIAIQYVKKILFSKLTIPEPPDSNTRLLYLTKNCRELDIEVVQDIVNMTDDEYLLATNDVDRYSCLATDRVSVAEVPISNIFERFSTYMYTPTFKVWDGSPRFPAECLYFDRDVEYYGIDDQYLSIDRGLYYRMNDMKQGLDKITLTNKDDIIDILNEII